MNIIKKNEAILKARKTLSDNKKGIEILEFLVEKNEQYQKAKRYTYVMYLGGAIIFFATLYILQQMENIGWETGSGLTFILGIVISGSFIGIPMIISNGNNLEIDRNDELEFINDLLFQHYIYEDFPVIEVNGNYYVEHSTGLVHVNQSLNSGEIDSDAAAEEEAVVGREYRYLKLCWDSRGFSLREYSNINVQPVDR